LHALEEAQQEAARQRAEEEERTAEELKKLQADLARERDDLLQHQAAQKDAAASVEQECAAKAKALEEQRRALDEQRKEVESVRMASEAERTSKLEELQRQQDVLQKQQLEVEQQRREDEKVRLAQAELVQHKDRELMDRAKRLQMTEQALLHERQNIHHSRAQLAVVQSHVLSMIGSAQKGSNTNDTIMHQTHNLDQADELETTDGINEEEASPTNRGDDNIYDDDVDWANVQSTVPEDTLEEER